ncbi:hypothetical protein AJ80_01853 [Polytolypa hystricis UAMH7299]|uniref:FAS1 domain-containing protein n=1 Tax=Polytolypa hystricis (strain UAMH7299) TaxID=1447883 RepID=A0A2B7YZW8_POLH7|nr:hypothetical protein AJ80_01853 [Polytolypa hystricis UAMH7299]
MSPFTLFILCLSVLIPFSGAVGLLEALRTSANAPRYADLIESDPALSAIFLDGKTGTVFAPDDAAVEAYLEDAARQLRPRQTAEEVRNNEFQAAESRHDIALLINFPGKVIETKWNGGLRIKGRGTPVVSEQDEESVEDNDSGNRTLRIRQLTNPTGPGVRLVSGFGKQVNIRAGDIPFDGGLIHRVDSFFTVPQTLSSTASQNGYSSFSDALEGNNLTSAFNEAILTTIFVPSNEAFAKFNGSINPSLLSNHIIPDFGGYLPELKDGATHTTADGKTLTITIKDRSFYINNAKIIQSNVILDNGVAHVVDSIISTAAPPPEFPGRAAGSYGSPIMLLTLLTPALIFWAFAV